VRVDDEETLRELTRVRQLFGVGRVRPLRAGIEESEREQERRAARVCDGGAPG
jgi:hypothetical protein